jgi:polyene macrolide polyketide synthase
MTEGLDGADTGRLARNGVVPLPAGEGLALFDAATGGTDPVRVPIRLDLAGLRGADPELVPALLRGLVRGQARRAANGQGPAAGLVERLSGLPAAERDLALDDLVRGQVAAVLGFSGAQAIAPDRAFSELGFDSLTAVELRNRLAAMTGLRLPATLVFDYPTSGDLSGYVGERLFGGDDDRSTVLTAFAGLEKLESSLALIAADEEARARVTGRLTDLLAALNKAGGEVDGTVAAQIDSASDDEVFAFIDQELGIQ